MFPVSGSRTAITCMAIRSASRGLIRISLFSAIPTLSLPKGREPYGYVSAPRHVCKQANIHSGIPRTHRHDRVPSLPFGIGERLLHNRVIAVARQAGAHGFSVFLLAERSYLNVKKRIARGIGDEDGILLLAQR